MKAIAPTRAAVGRGVAQQSLADLMADFSAISCVDFTTYEITEYH